MDELFFNALFLIQLEKKYTTVKQKTPRVKTGKSNIGI